MSSATFRAVMVAALASSALLPLAAQRSAEVRAQTAIVDSAVANWRRASGALIAYDDSASRARALTDTLRIGNLLVLTEPAIRARAEAATKVAARMVDSAAGTAATRLAGFWQVIRSVSGDTTRDTIVIAVRTTPKKGYQPVEYMAIWAAVNDSTIAAWLFQNSLRLLSESLDPEMRAWLHGTLVSDSIRTSQWLGTRLDLVSSPASVSRMCFDGDIAKCKVALRLVDVKDPIMEWFDAAGRRRYVEAAPWDARNRSPHTEACTAGSDAACIAFMRQVRSFGDPVPPYRRSMLANFATQMGGKDGLQRILNAHGTPAERLAIAAGVPVDSVLHAWVNNVRSARRPARDMTPGIAFASIGWVLVCGALALRSSRWR